MQNLDSIGRPDPCVTLNHLGVYLAVALRTNIALRTIDRLSACRNSGAITFSHITTMWLFFCTLFDCLLKTQVMYKTQIFQTVLKAVEEETELAPELIISTCKQEEVVDARAMLVKVMNEHGLYPVQIERLTGIDARRVTYFLLGFKDRINSRKILRINYENVKKKVGLSQE